MFFLLLLSFDSYFTEVRSQQSVIGSDNFSGRAGIIWANDGLVYSRIYPSCGSNKQKHEYK